MKTILSICLMLCCSSLLASEPGPKSIEELKSLFLESVKSKNLEKLQSLSYWEGTPEFVIKGEERGNKAMFNQNLPIISCEVTEIPSEFLEKLKKGFPYQGKVLGPNLEPLMRLTLHMGDAKNKHSTSRHIGKKNGVYYFLSSAYK